jgi:hypothetical protein
LGQLRLKLEARFDSESADELLSEIRSHLIDAAAEFELEGVSASEAERLSVARFGAPEKAAFLLPLGKQFGTGDRYWGRGAFWASTLAALGLTWYGLDPEARRFFSPNEIPPILALFLCFYGYACWKAKSFSMVRQSAVAIALMLLATGLFQRQIVEPAFGAGGSIFEELRAEKTLTAELAMPSWLEGNGLADLGYRARTDLATPERAARKPAEGDPAGGWSDQSKLYGMAPLGKNPWEISRGGLLPEVSQLLLTWLFFILMANASICWVGCIEHEQKGGALLVQ